MVKRKKVFKAINILVLILAFLSVYGFSVSYIEKGGNLGIFTKPIKRFISFPKTAIDVLKSSELKGMPPTYIKKDTSFKYINKLKYDVYGVNSSYNRKNDQWNINLFNFRNDSIQHQWFVKSEDFGDKNRKFKNATPKNSILLPNRSLIGYLYFRKDLFRLDKDSNIIWHNEEKLFHHGMNLGPDGNIWVCTSGDRSFEENQDQVFYTYTDDFVTRVDVETGELLFDKSISEILIENGYKNFVYGFSNTDEASREDDPLHLNDIEPVLEDGEFWKKGDLFISLRHRSLIIQYRPETNKIIKLLYGPFINQHDVDIISDTEISIFNNNNSDIGVIDDRYADTYVDSDKLKNSEYIIYNFKDSTFRKDLNKHFVKEKIYTDTEGLKENLSSGDVYVESQDDGKVFIMNNNEILLKKQFDTSVDNMVERPQWIRIYENINF